MEVILMWPNCSEFGLGEKGGPGDVFWVECSRDEAMDAVLPYVEKRSKREARKVAEEIEKCNEGPIADPKLKALVRENCVYFLMSRDLKLIRPMPATYPYTSEGKASSGFLHIFSQWVWFPHDVETIDAAASPLKEMKTWAGRRFWYIGSVEQGVEIYFGQGRRARVLPYMFANMLEHYGGRSVSLRSLARWLKKYVPYAPIASYVASILVAEGLAEADRPNKALRFVGDVSLELDYDSVRKYAAPVYAVYDPETGEETVAYGIDGKMEGILQRQGKALFKRVPRG